MSTKLIQLSILSLFLLTITKNSFAGPKKRFELVGTIISSVKGENLAIIRDTTTSETQILKQGKRLRGDLIVRNIEKDRVVVRNNAKNETYQLSRKHTGDPEEVVHEKKMESMREMKDVMQNLNDLKELRAYYEEKERELKERARR